MLVLFNITPLAIPLWLGYISPDKSVSKYTNDYLISQLINNGGFMIDSLLLPEIRVGNLKDEGFPSVQKGKGENEMGCRYSCIMRNLKNELYEIIEKHRDLGNEFTAGAGTPAHSVSSAVSAMDALLQKLDGRRLAECPAVAADGSNLEEVKTALTESAQATYEVVDQVKDLLRKESLTRAAKLTQLQRNIDQVAAKPELRQSSCEATQDEKRSSRYREFWNAIACDIKSIKKEYVDFYSTLTLKYADFYQKYIELQAAAAKAVKEGDDGNHVKWDAKDFQKKFKAFKDYVAETEVCDIPESSEWKKINGIVDDKEREKAINDLEKSLGLKPAFELERIKDESGKVIRITGKIKFNRTAIDSCPNQPSGIVESIIPDWTNNGQSTDMASYNAWLAAFNSMGNTFQSNMQTASQRYSQANSTFDNLNKVLSSSITALLECAKSFLVG
ncbi:IpaD/SipD/SspD family type III secretion system needle tip protein [Sodalis praecaptivus]|nr:IpaD/SipD/SspD family type III secretion system needle tip protein [Sodalis praecaptivus]